MQYYSSKVTVSGLAPHTTYYYQYENNWIWSQPVAFTTKSFTRFKLLLVGDPQIGASVGQTPSGGTGTQTAEIAACNDTYNWDATLKTALNAHPDVSFMISAGDQINYSKNDDTPQQEIEYSGFLSPKALKSLPLAAAIGNHDALTTNYQNHFNNPNPFTAESDPTAAGHGYYFTYGNALFIFINTNNYNCADHEALIKKAIQGNPRAKWRILTFHQDIYGSGKDHSDSDGIILRTQLTPIIDKYQIDAVLQGHDHTYSRTYPISGDGLTHTNYSFASTGNRIKWSDEKTAAYLEQNA
jgi:3',5'-cyclic AMP phosphodiesterase CpdA